MGSELLDYYNAELAYLRHGGAEFARQHPQEAQRLRLEGGEDPHVERLLEGFAFLAARVRLRIDDDFSELSEGLLELVYPHYIRPIPSMSVVEFQLDPEQGKVTTGLPIERGTELFYARRVGGVTCKFRTCYDTVLWPLQVVSAKWLASRELDLPAGSREMAGGLRIELRCPQDVTFAQLGLDTLRFHLRADATLASTLYEILCNNCAGILVRDGGRRDPLLLPASSIRPVGFDRDQSLFPHESRSFPGFRLLQEYFSFAQKFLFVDMGGFDQVRAAGFGGHAELTILIAPFERTDRQRMLASGVSRDVFRTGCTPVINLFPMPSEPIQLTQRQPEYLVVPDTRSRLTTAVYSVDDVRLVPGDADEVIRFEPLYSHRHSQGGEGSRFFWSARRRATAWRPDGETDVYLAFADLSGRIVHPALDTVTARLTCYNGSLPERLPIETPEGDFQMEGGLPISKINALVPFTRVADPQLGKAVLWRLISLLSLNYASLAESGVDGIRELLRLHCFAESPVADKQIDGIVGIRTQPWYARVGGPHGITYARGQRIELDFDEDHLPGGGAFLLASLLERVLGLFVSVNSFSVVAARTRQRKELLREWPPRSGWKPLL